jgi:DNA transformation protein and related proteins
MAVSSDYLAYVLDQLAALGELSTRRMFSCVGLYCGECFFAIIAADVLYLRADELNRNDFLARGCPPFRPYPQRPRLSMSYYEAPAEVLEDARALTDWARRSVAVAQRKAAPPRKGRSETPRQTKPQRAKSGRARSARGSLRGR